MRNWIKIFALLDVLSLLLLAPQFWNIITHLNEIPHQILSQAKVILLLPLFLSLIVSATGLLMLKKFGFIAYYIQFPFRLVVWIFSFGFITYIPELLHLGDNWFNLLFRLCFVTEFFRLYFSIKAHRQIWP